ncbi:MAG: GIY-YIG nuclease family protein [Candidatus Nomurabacteria bacterium]|nr:MAG: GIY-YIG nuclease family protein [Candidatus Nomurabacteria bacterium]
MAWVYILKTKSGKFYIGSTINLEQRLKHHKGGNTPSTYRLKFDSLLLSQEYDTLKDARSVESKLKKLKRKDYLQKIVEDGFIKIKP